MNTLTKFGTKYSDYENNRIIIEDFRYYQHALIEYFLEIIVKYISSKKDNHLTLNEIRKEEIFNYNGMAYNELDRYTINITNSKGVQKDFFRVYIPRLIYNNFYILNGNHYVPLFYIIDKPITIKENSVNLSSLFSSITLSVKKNICTFTGTNLDLQDFVNLFLIDDNSKTSLDVKQKLGISSGKVTSVEKKLIRYFNHVFNMTFNNILEIRNHIEDFFFDEYTRFLYTSCYSDDSIEVNNLGEIIKISLLRFFGGRIFNFIDLRNKRLCFIELLLAPLFKKAANIAYQTKKGFPTDEIKINQYAIIKHFTKSSDNKKIKSKKEQKALHGLSGKTLYDIVNLYSSLLIHKASFVKPGMKSPPSSISDIHQTHFGKICPITISSTKPGEMVSIVPETYVDIYGQFLDL